MHMLASKSLDRPRQGLKPPLTIAGSVPAACVASRRLNLHAVVADVPEHLECDSAPLVEVRAVVGPPEALRAVRLVALASSLRGQPAAHVHPGGRASCGAPARPPPDRRTGQPPGTRIRGSPRASRQGRSARRMTGSARRCSSGGTAASTARRRSACIFGSDPTASSAASPVRARHRPSPCSRRRRTQGALRRTPAASRRSSFS